MSLFFSFSSFVASNSAISNFASFSLASFSLASFSLASFSLASFSLASLNLASLNLASLNLASLNLASLNLASLNLASLNLASFSLLGFNSLTLNNLVGYNLVSFNSVGYNLASSSLVDSSLVDSSLVGSSLVDSSLVGSSLAGSDFDNKLRFANAGLFSNTPSSHLASRFFLQGPGSLLITEYNFNYHVRLSLLLSYFKPHYFSCQVYFADNLPNFRRNLPVSNLAMSGFSNIHLSHYTSPVHLPQAFSLPINQFDSNLFVFNNLYSNNLHPTSQLPYNLHPYVLESTTLHSPTLSSTLPQPTSLQPTPLSSSDSLQGGIFFQFSLPKLRLSSRSFALYLSKPSSLVPDPLANYTFSPNESVSAAGDSHIPDFNRSFYSQNLPSFVGLLGESINSIRDSTHNLINSIDTRILIRTQFLINSKKSKKKPRLKELS